MSDVFFGFNYGSFDLSRDVSSFVRHVRHLSCLSCLSLRTAARPPRAESQRPPGPFWKLCSWPPRVPRLAGPTLATSEAASAAPSRRTRCDTGDTGRASCQVCCSSTKGCRCRWDGSRCLIRFDLSRLYITMKAEHDGTGVTHPAVSWQSSIDLEVSPCPSKPLGK